MSALAVQKGLKLATMTKARVAASASAVAGSLGYTSAWLRGLGGGDGSGGSSLLLVGGGLALAGVGYLYSEGKL